MIGFITTAVAVLAKGAAIALMVASCVAIYLVESRYAGKEA